MDRVLLVALGGALGSVLRYLTALLAARWLGGDLPWGTLTVNLVGSFLIGVVHELGSEALRVSPEARPGSRGDSTVVRSSSSRRRRRR